MGDSSKLNSRKIFDRARLDERTLLNVYLPAYKQMTPLPRGQTEHDRIKFVAQAVHMVSYEYRAAIMRLEWMKKKESMARRALEDLGVTTADMEDGDLCLPHQAEVDARREALKLARDEVEAFAQELKDEREDITEASWHPAWLSFLVFGPAAERPLDLFVQTLDNKRTGQSPAIQLTDAKDAIAIKKSTGAADDFPTVLADANDIHARIISVMEIDTIVAVASCRLQIAKDMHDAVAAELRRRLDGQKGDAEFRIMLSADGALTADDKQELRQERNEIKSLLAENIATFVTTCKQIDATQDRELARVGATQARQGPGGEARQGPGGGARQGPGGEARQGPGGEVEQVPKAIAAAPADTAAIEMYARHQAVKIRAAMVKVGRLDRGYKAIIEYATLEWSQLRAEEKTRWRSAAAKLGQLGRADSEVNNGPVKRASGCSNGGEHQCPSTRADAFHPPCSPCMLALCARLACSPCMLALAASWPCVNPPVDRSHPPYTLSPAAAAASPQTLAKRPKTTTPGDHEVSGLATVQRPVHSAVGYLGRLQTAD